MTSRERFNRIMAYQKTDRVPYFEEGIRQDVLKEWYRQGLSKKQDIGRLFDSDRFYELAPELYPIPPLTKWPASEKSLIKLARRLNENNPLRLPLGWIRKAKSAHQDGQPVFLRVHRGLFLSLGVQNWTRFVNVLSLLMEKPQIIKKILDIQADFSARMAGKILNKVPVDAVIFSEPIGGNEGPLISPQMYEQFILASLEPVFQVIKQYQIKTVILRTYANSRILIPKILSHGLNCLWACETNIQEMDYPHIRREFGRKLRLIGGIDLDALRRGKQAIRDEIENKVLPLIADGGYIPLADGRIRPDVPYENYRYFRKLLLEISE